MGTDLSQHYHWFIPRHQDETHDPGFSPLSRSSRCGRFLQLLRLRLLCFPPVLSPLPSPETVSTSPENLSCFSSPSCRLQPLLPCCPRCPRFCFQDSPVPQPGRGQELRLRLLQHQQRQA